MGTNQHKNDSCLFPFGNNFMTLFALMVLDEEKRRKQEELDDDEDDGFVTGEDNDPENDDMNDSEE